MPLSTTLGALSHEVHEKHRHYRHDRHVPVKDLKFESLNAVRIGDQPHPLEQIAQRSISNRLGIPFNYLRRCPEDLQAQQLAHWLQDEPQDELFFRFDGNNVRAIFTPRYKPIDNHHVLDALIQLGYGEDTTVHVSLDSQFMSLNIPDPKSVKILGDELSPGISISNSEVGLASLKIEAFFLRLVCTNGMVTRSQTSSSYRHISQRALECLPETISSVRGEASIQSSRIRISMETPVEEPGKTMESINRRFMLSEMEQQAVEWGWAFEPGSTMWQIANAYTKAAQYQSLPAESVHRLQTIGGEVLALPS